MLSKRAANPNASVIRVNHCAGYQDECQYCMVVRLPVGWMQDRVHTMPGRNAIVRIVKANCWVGDPVEC